MRKVQTKSWVIFLSFAFDWRCINNVNYNNRLQVIKLNNVKVSGNKVNGITWRWEVSISVKSNLVFIDWYWLFLFCLNHFFLPAIVKRQEKKTNLFHLLICEQEMDKLLNFWCFWCFYSFWFLVSSIGVSTFGKQIMIYFWLNIWLT